RRYKKGGVKRQSKDAGLKPFEAQGKPALQKKAAPQSKEGCWAKALRSPGQAGATKSLSGKRGTSASRGREPRPKMPGTPIRRSECVRSCCSWRETRRPPTPPTRRSPWFEN